MKTVVILFNMDINQENMQTKTRKLCIRAITEKKRKTIVYEYIIIYSIDTQSEVESCYERVFICRISSTLG